MYGKEEANHSSDKSSLTLADIMSDSRTLIVSVPGAGLVGNFAASYVIQKTKMNQISEIEHPALSDVVFVSNGDLLGPIRTYKKGNLYALISDIPVYQDLGPEFGQIVTDFCKEHGISNVLLLSGLPTDRRKKQNLKTYGLVTDQRFEKLLYDNNIAKFLDGMITGTEAIVLNSLRRAGIPSLAIYTECYLFFPDPEAAIDTIDTVSKIIELGLDTSDFRKHIEQMKIQNRQLMQDTIQALQEEKEGKGKRVAQPTIYR